jgi:hypothetical protein
MCRKRVLVLDGAVLIVAAVAGAAVLLWPGPQKTPFRAQFDRVRRGMTAEEVHEVVGRPNDNLPWPPGEDMKGFGFDRMVSIGPTLRRDGSEESSCIHFKDGRMTRKEDGRGNRHEPSALGALLDRLGW